jgi:hypothetical protein
VPIGEDVLQQGTSGAEAADPQGEVSNLTLMRHHIGTLADTPFAWDWSMGRVVCGQFYWKMLAGAVRRAKITLQDLIE